MTNQELLQIIKRETQEDMDTRGMFNENPFDKPRKVTYDEVLMEKIQEMKKEVVDGERFRFKIPDNMRPRELIMMFSQAFEKMGIEIEFHISDDVPYLTPMTGLSNPTMDVSIRRISDQNVRRIMEIEERDVRLRHEIEKELRKKLEKEYREKMAREMNAPKASVDIEKLRSLAGISKGTAKVAKKVDKINKKSKKKVKKKKTSIDIFKDHKRRLIKKENGKLNWSDGKSFEEARNEPKNTEYQEKIKWFCEKYGENYEIIYESFKDDDLDNLIWKGEKVEFPKK